LGEKLLSELSRLITESRNPETEFLDQLDTLSLLQRLNDQDAQVPAALRAALADIAKVTEMAAGSFRAGGRLIYVGAGTSGRLGVLDAAECPPTFGTDPSQVLGIIAGGPPALLLSQEGLEDRPELGASDLSAVNAGPADTVVGISASHRTPYTIGAVEEARRRGCRTAFITCNPDVQVPGEAVIRLVVGPEALTGSTRLKSGSAQKMALNMISTAAMVLTGRVYGNLMVDMVPWSEKLEERGRGLIMTLTGLDYERAKELLSEGGNVKTSLLMQMAGLDREAAESRLAKAGGFLRKALEEDDPGPSAPD